MARPRKSNNIKVLSGSRHAIKGKNDAKNSINLADWQPPETLGQFGRYFWIKTLPLLSEKGIIEETDSSAFEELCHTWNLLREIQKEIAAVGITVEDQRGSYKKNPALGAYNQVLTHFENLCKEFFLTPFSRQRGGISTTEDVDPNDPWANFGN